VHGDLLTPVRHAEVEELSVGSERSSLSPVDDEAATSRLELFQISALSGSESCYDDPPRDSAVIATDKWIAGLHPDFVI